MHAEAICPSDGAHLKSMLRETLCSSHDDMVTLATCCTLRAYCRRVVARARRWAHDGTDFVPCEPTFLILNGLDQTLTINATQNGP